VQESLDFVFKLEVKVMQPQTVVLQALTDNMFGF